MLTIWQPSSVYNLLGFIVLITFSALSHAERTLEENSPSKSLRHNSQVRQVSGRAPASIISNEHSPTDRPEFHPISPQKSETYVQEKSDKNGGTSFPNPLKRAPSVIESTLSGQIEKWSGNQMPTRGPGKGDSKKNPIQTQVYVFKGKIKSEGGPVLESASTVHKVFAVVNSDKNGTFKVQLPPGEYTVFAVIDGKLYNNSFDGLGNFSSITMVDGKDSNETIIDSREASF